MSTKENVKDLIRIMEKRLGKEIEMEYAYNRPRLVFKDGRYFSPRLTIFQLEVWLWGGITALDEQER